MTQHPAPQPGYPADPNQAGAAPWNQGPPAGAPMGHLLVNIQGSVMTRNMLTPTLMVDGYQMPSTYGVNTMVVPAGVHRVQLHAQWLLKYGQATLDVHVPPNDSVQVFYAAPLHQFASTGNIGLEPQRAKGGWVVWLMIAIIVTSVVFIATILLSTT